MQPVHPHSGQTLQKVFDLLSIEQVTIFLSVGDSDTRSTLISAIGQIQNVAILTEFTQDSSTPDFIIVDYTGLQRCFRLLIEHRQKVFPAIIPLLLVTPRLALPSIEENFMSAVDDILLLPLDYYETQIRFRNLMRLRTYSARADKMAYRNPELAHSLIAPPILLNAVSDAIIATDMHLNIISWNNAAEQIYGWKAAEAIGHHVSEILRSSLTKRERDTAIRNIISTGSVHSETTHTHKDGTPIYILAATTPLYDDAGNPVGLVSINRNITEIVRAREQLSISESHYREIVENVQEGIWSIDNEGKTTFVNTQIIGLLGFSQDEMLGKSFFDFMGEAFVFSDMLPDLNAQTLCQLIAGTGISDYRMKRKDGTWMWALITATPTYVHAVQSGALITITDITARKLSEQNLEETIRNLNATIESSRQLLIRASSKATIAKVCQLAVEEFHIKMAWVGRVYEGDYRVYPVAAFGDGTAYIDSEEYTWDDSPRGQTPIGEAIRNQAPIIVNQLGASDQAARDRGFTACAILPLVQQGRVLAVFCLYSAAQNFFTEIRVQALQLLVNLGVNAVRNALLDEENHAHLEELTALHRASQTLQHLYRSGELAHIILDLLDDLIEFDCASLIQIDPAASTATTLAWLGPPEYIGRSNAIHPYTSGVGILGKVIATGHSLIIADTNDTAPELLENWLCGTSILAVPLQEDQRITGLLIVESLRPRTYTDSHQKRLETLSAQVAVAMRNAALFDEVSLRRQQMEHLSQQIILTQEEERKRIAYELHDEAGQALTGLNLSLQVIMAELPPDFKPVRQRLRDAINLLDTTMDEIRQLAHNLRPSALDNIGLNVVLHAHCRDFTRRTRIQVFYEGHDLPTLPGVISITLYRFLQEALTNVIKHAEAHKVFVNLEYDGTIIQLSVQDDGKGFDLKSLRSPASPPRGIGLLGIEERLTLLNGYLTVQSQVGKGTELTAYLTFKGEPHD